MNFVEHDITILYDNGAQVIMRGVKRFEHDTDLEKASWEFYPWGENVPISNGIAVKRIIAVFATSRLILNPLKMIGAWR